MRLSKALKRPKKKLYKAYKRQKKTTKILEKYLRNAVKMP